MSIHARLNVPKKRPENYRMKRYGLIGVEMPAASIEAVEHRISGMLDMRVRQFSSFDKAIKMAMIDAYSQGLFDGAQVSTGTKEKAGDS